MRWPSFATTKKTAWFSSEPSPHASPHTDDSPSESDVPAKVYITSDGKMIKLDDLWDLLEPFLELLNLLEMITKLDDRNSLKHPGLVENKLAVTQRVDVTLNE